jgi:hypothetical protein
MATCRSSNKTKSAALNQFSALTRFSVFALGILALSGIASAQSKFIPGIDVFGGYSHLTVPTSNLGFGNRTELNGFHVALSIPHIYKGLGIAIETSGNYATPLEQYNYAVGAQYTWEFNRFRVIAHGLYGKAQTRVRDIGTTFVEPSDRQRALTFGGEVDIPISSRFWFRAVQADWVRTTAFNNSLNELRLSTGLVYSLGKH